MAKYYSYSLINELVGYLDGKDESKVDIPKNFLQKQIDEGEMTKELVKDIIFQVNIRCYDRKLKFTEIENKIVISIIVVPEGFMWIEDLS